MKKSVQERQFLPIAIGIVIVAAIGYLAFRQIRNWHQHEVATALERQQEIAKAEADTLKEKVVELEEELRRQTGGLVPEDRLFEVFGEDAPLLAAGEKVGCEVLERQIQSFLRYLDRRDYIKAYKLKNGAAGLYHELVARLSATPPTIVGETRDIFTLVRNMAHLNRVLEKKRLKLLMEVLNSEGDIAEPLMATFYAWFTQTDDCRKSEIERPSLETLYEYAGFFLNTLGGRSYLFRRNSKVRTLANYYCVLIIDQANTRTLNPYGIDISRSVEALIYDMNNATGLLQRKLYLAELQSLKEKYELQKPPEFSMRPN